MSKQGDFSRKSTKTTRTPEKSTTPTTTQYRKPNLEREDRTRSQQRKEEKKEQNAKNTEETIKDKINHKKTEEAKQPATTERTIPTIPKTQTREVEQETSPIKMNQQKIQQQIAAFVPEFSGDETDPWRVENNLTKFIGTADIIYNGLDTIEEKKYFEDIIKYRLTGTAFTAIARQQIKDYETVKRVLNNMYGQVYSLNELENNYQMIKQQYGEPIRKYGYRLTEALEQYKAGFKTKYGMNQLEDMYTKHLNEKCIETFKRGLVNNVLKEKIATSVAVDIEQLINETEKIEKMLSIVSTPQQTLQQTTNNVNQQVNSQPWVDQNQQILEALKQIQQSTAQGNTRQWNNQTTCNYCGKANHTWKMCRSRLQTEHNRQTETNTDYNRRIPDVRQIQNYPEQGNRNQNTRQNYYQQNPTNFQRYQQQPQRNYAQYGQSQPNNREPYTPKYCSHCKITKGHTFEECRSKLYNRKPYSTNDYTRQNPPQQYHQPNQQQNFQYHQPNNRQPVNGDKLAEQLQNMKINQIAPYQVDNTQQGDIQQMQGNANGSSRL